MSRFKRWPGGIFSFFKLLMEPGLLLLFWKLQGHECRVPGHGLMRQPRARLS